MWMFSREAPDHCVEAPDPTGAPPKHSAADWNGNAQAPNLTAEVLNPNADLPDLTREVLPISPDLPSCSIAVLDLKFEAQRVNVELQNLKAMPANWVIVCVLQRNTPPAEVRRGVGDAPGAILRPSWSEQPWRGWFF